MKNNFKRFVYSILFLLSFTFCLSGAANAASLEQIKSNGFINFATNAEFEPFEYKDGDKIVGIDVDIAKIIAQKLGVELRVNDVSFDAVTLELTSRKCDFAVAAMSYSQDKAMAVDFSEPYYFAKQVVIVPNKSSIKSPEELKNKVIGVHLGCSGDIYCTENFKDATIERYNRGSDALQDLINGRLDAVVIDDIPAQKLVRLANHKVKLFDDILFEESYRVAVPKGSTELLEAINQIILELKNTNEVDKMVEKYVSQISSPSVDIFAQFYNNLVYKNRYLMILNGLGTTVQITMVALIIGVIIGLAVSLVKVSSRNNWVFKCLRFLADAYLTVIRGTPVVVQLFVIYYLVFSSTSLNKIVVAMIAFGINSGAYVSEIIRSGIMSVDAGQYEAGRSLGLNERITMTKIILPQAIKNVLPTLVNEFIQLIKETSVAGFIGITDLSRAGDIIRSQTYEPLVPLLTVALIYLITVIIMTMFLSFVERRMRSVDKR